MRIRRSKVQVAVKAPDGVPPQEIVGRITEGQEVRLEAVRVQHVLALAPGASEPRVGEDLARPRIVHPPGKDVDAIPPSRSHCLLRLLVDVRGMGGGVRLEDQPEAATEDEGIASGETHLLVVAVVDDHDRSVGEERLGQQEAEQLAPVIVGAVDEEQCDLAISRRPAKASKGFLVVLVEQLDVVEAELLLTRSDQLPVRAGRIELGEVVDAETRQPGYGPGYGQERQSLIDPDLGVAASALRLGQPRQALQQTDDLEARVAGQ